MALELVKQVNAFLQQQQQLLPENVFQEIASAQGANLAGSLAQFEMSYVSTEFAAEVLRGPGARQCRASRAEEQREAPQPGASELLGIHNSGRPRVLPVGCFHDRQD